MHPPRLFSSMLLVLLSLLLPTWVVGQALSRREASLLNPLEYGSSCTTATLNAAITAAPASGRVLMLTPSNRAGVPCVWAITSNVTVPATLVLHVPHGASVSISSGITLTLVRRPRIDTQNWVTGTGTLVVQEKAPYGANCLDAQWGVVADGVTNAQPGLQRAVTYLASQGGGKLVCPAGNYLLNAELLIPHMDVELERGIVLEGEAPGATRFLAGTNGQTMIHFSGSHGGLRHLTLDANGKTGISALRMTPEDEAQTTTRVDQNYNLFEDLHIEEADEGIVMQCGPDVGGADSGCWYNLVQRVHIQRTLRGLWLKNCANASCSGVNGNMFHGVRVGQVPTNTCLQIDAGATNGFHKLDCEGILTGTTPSATPTALVIALAGTFSGNNDSNKFFGGRHEATTRSFVNNNPSTEFYGVTFAPEGVTPGFQGSSVLPLMMIGGDQNSNIPLIVKGLIVQGNSQINSIGAYGNNTLESNYDFVLRGFYAYDYVTEASATHGAGKWQTHTLAVGDTTNITSIAAGQANFAQAFGGMIDWHFRMQFRATTANQPITFLLPIRPAAAPYITGLAPMHFPVMIYNGTTPSLALAQIAGTAPDYNLTIAAPTGDWNIAAESNLVELTIRYMGHGY